MKFYGYKREDEKVGVRNLIAVVPTIVCADFVSRKIKENYKNNVIVLSHPLGCGMIGKDLEIYKRTLTNICAHPNIGGVLLVGLGCEMFPPNELKMNLNKPVRTLIIQEEGGTTKSIMKGRILINELIKECEQYKREEIDIKELIVGVECGGSDFTSGLASNPSVGKAMDMLIEQGGSVIISEVAEFLGAEHILKKRCKNEEVGEKLVKVIRNVETIAKREGVDIKGAQPSPGNMEGGITTIEEKSLGCIYKCGSGIIQGVVDYAEPVTGKGLFVMDTTGYDPESISGMVAGGAQIIIFTTGRGSVLGNPLVPVIKVTGNKKTFERMQDDMDIDVSGVLTGKSIYSMGKVIFEEIIRVANGKKTKSEILGHDEFAISRMAPTV